MVRALSILFAAAPFLFGALRAVRGSDLRMLWMAAASAVGAVAVRWVAARRPSGSTAAYTFATLALTTLLAGGTAILLGARAAVGIWLVALVLGLCWTASHALAARARGDS